MSEEEEREEAQSGKVKVVDRRRFVLDDEGDVVERPDAPASEHPKVSVPPPGAGPQGGAQSGSAPAGRADAGTQSQAGGGPGDSQQASQQQSAQEPGQGQDGSGAEAAADQATTELFLGFLNSMAHSMLIHLGEVAEPTSGLVRQNLEGAQQTLEILSVLRQKTQGNLTPQEARTFDSLLYELMARFRDQAEAAAQPPPGGASQ